MTPLSQYTPSPDLLVAPASESERSQPKITGVPVKARQKLSLMALTERVFERLLWSSRVIVLVAVTASLVVSVGMFFVATVDVVQITRHMGGYAYVSGSVEEHELLRTQTISHIVEVIDGYLLATIMLIFAFGLYELFISPINAAEGNKLASRILLIHNLDDLKDRLAKVVLLILVVKFFRHALQLDFRAPLDLVYLSIGILFVAGALYLSHKNGSHSSKEKEV